MPNPPAPIPNQILYFQNVLVQHPEHIMLCPLHASHEKKNFTNLSMYLT